MFITAVCVLFLIKLRWPKNKSIYYIEVYRFGSFFRENWSERSSHSQKFRTKVGGVYFCYAPAHMSACQ